MRYEQTMQVMASEGRQLEQACREPLTDCGRDETIFDQEVEFVNDTRMAIQVIAAGADSGESAWTQGVIFDEDGEELGCTEVKDTFAGEYCVTVDGDTYVCNVVLVEGM